jgi:2,3-bisphosphoglycerate-dependent phosphoglycerate mutase
MAKLILLRHGESIWNALNLFTGWVDVPLSLKGIEEAFEAGRTIKDIPIDIIYVSALSRAITTALLVMTKHSSKKVPVINHKGEGKMSSWGKIHNHEAKENTIPVVSAWQINERMYGDLQGLNKAETIAKYGKEQVQIWRRSYDIAPPNGESLKMTAERSIPYFNESIIPHLVKGENVLISAHGNSLRSIMMELDNLTPEEVVALELPTGKPIIYNFENGNLSKVIS